MKKICLIICVLTAVTICVTGTAMAFDPLTIFSYNMAQPLGELKEVTPDFSWRGWTFGYRNFIRDQVSLGISFSWQGFSMMEQGSFTEGPVTATGTQVRYINSFPIMATGHFYTGGLGGFRLYGGLGVGTFYVQRRYDFGLARFYDNSWHFGLVPEAGIMLPLGASPWMLLGNVTYNYAFQTKDTSSLSYVGFNIGFAFEN